MGEAAQRAASTETDHDHQAGDSRKTSHRTLPISIYFPAGNDPVLSRGNKREGKMFYTAFTKGARFDSWEELTHRDLWRSIFSEAGWDVEAWTCRARDADESLPWD